MIIDAAVNKAIKHAIKDKSQTDEQWRAKSRVELVRIKPELEKNDLDCVISRRRGFLIIGGKSEVIYNVAASTAYYFNERGVRTTYGCHNWAHAIRMAMNDQPNSSSRRKNTYRRDRQILLAVRPNCFWCNMPLNKITATLDHIVPLPKNGTNAPSNQALACKDCNHDKNDIVRKLSPEQRVLYLDIRKKMLALQFLSEDQL